MKPHDYLLICSCSSVDNEDLETKIGIIIRFESEKHHNDTEDSSMYTKIRNIVDVFLKTCKENEIKYYYNDDKEKYGNSGIKWILLDCEFEIENDWVSNDNITPDINFIGQNLFK